MYKKHLGQHFLHDPKLLQKVVDLSGVTSSDVVLEIGPGAGALTKPLLEASHKVIAVEYDADLIPELTSRFSKELQAGRFSIINADFLEVKESDIIEGDTPYKVVANIPYYITGAIIRKLLESEKKPLTISLIMQKEVAMRIVLRDGKHSLLSLSVALYGTPKMMLTLARGAFVPPPKVDSALLTIQLYDETLLPGKEVRNTFFELIHAGFSQKRKQLRVLVKELFSTEVFEKWCGEFGFENTVRAEDVEFSAWINLSETLIRIRGNCE